MTITPDDVSMERPIGRVSLLILLLRSCGHLRDNEDKTPQAPVAEARRCDQAHIAFGGVNDRGQR
jgi:hypothetical protein